MSTEPLPVGLPSPSLGVIHESLRIVTVRPLELVDITDEIESVLRRSGVIEGVVNVQTRHTTTAIVLNENEPLLFEDLAERLERWAPAGERYRHDDLRIRTVNLTAEERPNGHAHLRALALGASESINVHGGELRLGRWQRVFLVELDGGQSREVCVTALGLIRTHPGERAATYTPRRLRARAVR